MRTISWADANELHWVATTISPRTCRMHTIAKRSAILRVPGGVDSWAPDRGSDVGGIPFLLSRCQAGRPFASGSAEDLAGLIEDIYVRYQDYARAAQRSAKIARKMFSWKAIGKAMACEIRRVIDRGAIANELNDRPM